MINKICFQVTINIYRHNPIMEKGFIRYERKRIKFCAFVLCFIAAWGISSTNFSPHFRHPLSLVGAPIKLQLPRGRGGDMNEQQSTSNATVGDLGFPVNTTEKMSVSVNDTNRVIPRTTAMRRKKMQPLCRDSHYCEIEGDIRIQANSCTIFVATPAESISTSTSIEPYPRNGTARVKNWILRPKSYGDIPNCTRNHSDPVILFSTGGYSGNLFHDFADVLFPLYLTSFGFNKDVHFLVSDYRRWWIYKYRQILDKLTKHEMVDIGTQNGQVHCCNKLFSGLKFHKELVISPSWLNSPAGPSMHNFRQVLRQAYSLGRKRAIRLRKGEQTMPRLMIISRQRSRILMNMGELSRLATKLGYDVIIAEARVSTNVSRFADTVNSCDVLLGIHGAGLTNMVFLPDNAVVIQVVPYGGIDGYAKLDFGNPADGMNLRYLEYKVRLKESTLIKQYPTDHPILKNPKSYKGWDALWSIYLDKQNVTIDLHRFKATLVKALRLLRH